MTISTNYSLFLYVPIYMQVYAQGIYDELQGIMDAHGQESIANLMPLVVNVLENLDSALADNQVPWHTVELLYQDTFELRTPPKTGHFHLSRMPYLYT